MTKRNISIEDISNFIDKGAQKTGGYIILAEIFSNIRTEASNFKFSFNKFSELAREYSQIKGYKIGNPPNPPPKPLLPRTPSLDLEKVNPPTTDFDPITPIYTFDDIGGLENQKNQLLDLILLPIQQPNLFKSVGAKPVRGILLHGPSGCGKSILVEAAAGEFLKYGITYFKASAIDLISSVSNQSESKIRTLFQAALNSSPSIIFIDEIDAIAKGKSNSSRDNERKLISQLTQSIDKISIDSENHVVVIGATSKIDSIDSTLRRPGRFSREISLGIPDFEQRLSILNILCKNINISSDLSIEQMAREAEGYVGADLNGLIQEAALFAVKRASSLKEEEAVVIFEDFENALRIVQPSLRREGFTSLPPASFKEIGGLEKVKEELQMAVVDAIIRPDIFALYGHRPAAGVLLYGPPGCGKTLMARAIAHEANRAAFISVKGPELLNKYLGESESAVRSVFRRARDSAPCIIFFDEIDAICPRRSDDSSNAAASRVVNQLLTEMDGVVDRGRVFVIGATNRLELIDEAMLRPGRLDKKIEVPLPNKEGRIDILNKQLNKVKNKGEINTEKLAEICENYSGAELEALITEAIEIAIKESTEENWIPVQQIHLELAYEKLGIKILKKK